MGEYTDKYKECGKNVGFQGKTCQVHAKKMHHRTQKSGDSKVRIV